MNNKRVKYEEPCDGRLSSTVPREGRGETPLHLLDQYMEATITHKKKIIDLKEKTFKALSVMARKWHNIHLWLPFFQSRKHLYSLYGGHSFVIYENEYRI